MWSPQWNARIWNYNLWNSVPKSQVQRQGVTKQLKQVSTFVFDSFSQQSLNFAVLCRKIGLTFSVALPPFFLWCTLDLVQTLLKTADGYCSENESNPTEGRLIPEHVAAPAAHQSAVCEAAAATKLDSIMMTTLTIYCDVDDQLHQLPPDVLFSPLPHIIIIITVTINTIIINIIVIMWIHHQHHSHQLTDL